MSNEQQRTREASGAERVSPATQRYRILLPLRRATDQPGLIRLAQVLARALAGEILILRVYLEEEPDDEVHLAALEDMYFQDIHYEVLTHQANSVAEGIRQVAIEHNVDLILLNWRGRAEALRQKLSRILDPVLERAPCDVALLKGELEVEKGEIPSEDILIATANGTNALASAELAFAIAKLCKGRVTLLTVTGEQDGASEEEANRLLDQLVDEAALSTEEESRLVMRQIVHSKDIEGAVLEAAKNHGLIFLGAPSGTVMNQLLRGTATERLATEIEAPVVIVKRYRGLTHFWVRRVWRFLNGILPDVDAEARLAAYKEIRRGARGTEDYYTMMLLSSVIATMGLLLNSGAVIIGAMLVAPLMLPVLALGMGVVLGDVRLLRLSGQSTALGVLLGIAVSALLAFIAPLAVLTPEIEARTHPNLFDLTVALAAGAAGAFAVSRKTIAEALPGVAIAAALVPPISVAGICLATARWAAAGGALLLFATNLTAIGLAAAVVYFLLGYFPQAEEQERFVARRRGFLITLAILFAMTLPLARTLEQEVQRVTVGESVRTALEDALREEPGIILSEYNWESAPGQPLYLRVFVFTTREVNEETLVRINQKVSKALGREVTVQLAAIPITEIENTTAPTDTGR